MKIDQQEPPKEPNNKLAENIRLFYLQDHTLMNFPHTYNWVNTQFYSFVIKSNFLR
ncbi:hypothetical protein SAMN05421788_110190 [Filimonas lacunae]|uniref:Uncharacterized protein n=1 Tax=Filimonas lacunae TaxID=477680 RepID=A0A173MA95_9BACT|nr:hypothetical protein FLA_0447 [Filimonas lacunae]SIT31481.1 hypothetical protein SAMN05421788_110190 [Filimonas lacunae]